MKTVVIFANKKNICLPIRLVLSVYNIGFFIFFCKKSVVKVSLFIETDSLNVFETSIFNEVY